MGLTHQEGRCGVQRNDKQVCVYDNPQEQQMSVTSVDYGKFEAPIDGGPCLDRNMDLIKP